MKSFSTWKLNEYRQKRSRITSAATIMILMGLFFLYNWIAESLALTHIPPKVERINIEHWIYKEEITQHTKELFSSQTGICRATIELLLAQGREEEILKLQEKYFAPVNIKAQQTTPLTVSECLVNEKGEAVMGMPLVDIKDGDILVTKNSRFLGWRNGHAGLVIDAEKGLVLEAIMLGTDTCLNSVKKWSTYPSFQVLRLKEEYDRCGTVQENHGEQGKITRLVAEYAMENLQGIPYGLGAGVLDRMLPKKGREGIVAGEVKSTQCAHLVWYAYKQFGIDLDSDGGLVVTPFDIQSSDYLEVIQTYGY